jgi:capsular polysaccharide biosynthesis protein
MVYIDRQTGDRRLPDTDHESLLAGVAELADREGWEFAYLEVHAMTPPEQVAAVAHASVMFGVHGNGLTHELWLPEDATLIEVSGSVQVCEVCADQYSSGRRARSSVIIRLWRRFWGTTTLRL